MGRGGWSVEREEAVLRTSEGRLFRLVAALALFTSARGAGAASAGAEIRGLVVDPAGLPAPGARVVLLPDRGSILRSAASDATGASTIAEIGPGTYHARAERPPLESALLSVVVESALAQEIRLALAPRASETLVV